MAKLYAFILLILLSACKHDPLDGIDKTALFAAPTAAELTAIQAEWSKRDLKPVDVTIEETHPINNRLNYQLISFRLSGYKQYAGVLVPITSKYLPVRLSIYGFSLTDPVNHQNVKIGSSETDTLPFIYVVPALKGQSLSFIVNDIAYKSPSSEGVRSDAFDGAADDAIASLNAVGALFKNADTSKVTIRGGSRGGTVALLMAERDKRVKLAVGVAFPTDLLTLTSAYQNDPTYKFQFLDALTSGKATLQEARKKMIASSPIYFCGALPKTQIHFGDKDVITPAAQGEMLYNAMKQLGKEAGIELFVYNGRGHEDIMNDNSEMEARIEQFLQQVR